MRKLTRLEISCVFITALILTVMATDMVVSQQERQARASEQSDDDLAMLPRTTTAAAGDEAGAAAAGSLSASGEHAPDFTERARHIPNPLTNADAASSIPVTTNGVALAPPVQPPRPFSTNDVARELERIAAMPWSPASEQLLQATMAKWAANDPTAALQYALQIESRRVRSTLVSSIFNTWAKSDVNGAYSWLMANRESDPGTFQMGLRPVFTALAASGIDGAMHMALDIPNSSDRLSAMRVVVEQASRNGVSSTMVSYMESLQKTGDRQNFASMLAQNWATYAPQEAAQWAATLTDPALKNAALSSAIGSWAWDNPSAAAAWVTALPESELRSRQMAQVTTSWARYDPVQAADWLLSQHPPSAGLDPSIQGLVGTVMKSNPEGAVMWATTISDPKLRSSTIISASREWMKSDPQKATAYILTAPLTPAQRTRLLQGR